MGAVEVTDEVEVEDAVMVAVAVAVVVVTDKQRFRRSAFSRNGVREWWWGVSGNDET